jgi:hypothetical protein
MASLILDNARSKTRPTSRTGGDHETASYTAAITNSSDLLAVWRSNRRLHHFDDGRIHTLDVLANF